MRDLDETDLEILRLLLADARRPYSEIGDVVGLSGPAVSERVSRLREVGVIEQFTVNVDRSKLTERVRLLVDVAVEPGHASAVYDALLDADGTQHAYRSADAHVVAHVGRPDADVESWLADAVDTSVVDDYTVRVLAESEWTNSVADADFAISCAECGNTVTSEGTAARLGGELYQFCCPTCESRFREAYEELAEDA
ncbi:AsnC family transcriptional regulator (plasmid) [Halarchaeum sp. CBA1220]|uniref:AsnC family transcriptional regulator n=1 Tax=Halarchaeum sp. CBA1220 TaxID=1853682 RepID=UPI000F3A80E1|nr:AsnC family transcriptional regulator [Halarchaeum sp. CBA1220]QLC34907.1 AsnC family transcriptional regulator [Halarchaeum sp. CBA1220]